jgi:hypothetical protein
MENSILKIFTKHTLFLLVVLSYGSSEKEWSSQSQFRLNLDVSIQDEITEKIADIHPKTSTKDSLKIHSITQELDAMISFERNKGKTIKKLAAEKFTKPVRLTLVIYNQAKTQILINQQVTVGVDPNINLDGNKVYHWFAVSTHELNNSPSVASNGDISRESIENKDFLFDKGTLNTAVTGNNYLKINFKRQTSKMGIHIETRGLFGGIEDDSQFEVGEILSGNFQSLIYTGKFNIKTETFTDLRPVAPVFGSQMELTEWFYHENLENLTAAEVAITPTSKSFFGNESKTAYFYSVRPINTSVNSLRLRLNTLKIKLDDNTIRTFSSNSILTIPSSTPISLPKGNSIIAKVNMIESGLNMGTYSTSFANTNPRPNIWARTNIRYNASKKDLLRFRPNNSYALPAYDTEYFSNRVNPLIHNNDAAQNMCRYVYPYNTWINAELEAFSELGNTFTSSHTTISGTPQHTVIFNPPTAQNNTAYQDNKLVLPIFGIRSGATNAFINHGKDSPTNISPSTVGTITSKLNYLTNSSTLNTSNSRIFTINRLHMTQNSTSRNFTKYSATPTTINRTNDIATAGNGYPVRCIRLTY